MQLLLHMRASLAIRTGLTWHTVAYTLCSRRRATMSRTSLTEAEAAAEGGEAAEVPVRVVSLWRRTCHSSSPVPRCAAARGRICQHTRRATSRMRRMGK